MNKSTCGSSNSELNSILKANELDCNVNIPAAIYDLDCTIRESEESQNFDENVDLLNGKEKKQIFIVEKQVQEKSRMQEKTEFENINDTNLICNEESNNVLIRERVRNNVNSKIAKKEEKFICHFTHCEKIYKSKENLILHIKNKHLGIKPYKCNFCSSRFSHRNGKSYHERTYHDKLFSYKCDQQDCEMSFVSKSALLGHIKRSHS